MNLNINLDTVKAFALCSGKKVLEIYNSNNNEYWLKEDQSPLTKADLAANEIIVNGIKKYFPKHGILSEESKEITDRLKKEFVWIIDPLDGTKEFIKKNGEFTVNIALINNGVPILGLVYAPVLGELYYAIKGHGAYVEKKNKKENIHVSNKHNIKDFSLVVSRSHLSKKMKEIIKKISFSNVIQKGSSLKGCLVAKGDADVYFRLGPTNEWDVCAMDIIVKEAGGLITDLEGELIKYNKKDTLINGFLVSNNKIHKKLLNLVKK